MMTPTIPIKIMDVTIKEGGFRVHHRVSSDQVADLTQELQRAGVRYVHLSHGCGIAAFKAGYPGLVHDKELLTSAKLAAPEIKFCVYIYPSLGTVQEISPLINYFHLARVGVNYNEPHCALEHITQLRKNEKTVIGEILRAHGGTAKEVADTGMELKKQGCEILYLTDTFGSMSEEDVRRYLGELKDKTGLAVGFQGRNHLGRAISNSLTALEVGVEWLDGSLMGLGDGPGVTNMEILVAQLEARGIQTGLNLRELTFAAKNFALPIFGFPMGVRLIDLLSAKYKIDFYPRDLLLIIAEILDFPLENIFLELREQNPQLVQLRVPQLRNFLSNHSLDYDVVLEYLKTGKIPSPEEPI